MSRSFEVLSFILNEIDNLPQFEFEDLTDNIPEDEEAQAIVSIYRKDGTRHAFIITIEEVEDE